MSDENGTETALVIRAASLPSVQAMRNKLAEQAEVRDLLLTHIKGAMVEGLHFGTIPGTQKPMLYQDGARLIQTIFEVTPGQPEIEEEYFEDGHYRCTVHVPFLSQATGDIVRRGTGSCSTRESRYAYRWVFKNEVPVGVDVATLKRMERPKKDGNGTYTKYQLPNEDLADLYHTVLTMALKRADTRATMRLPCVGDIFSEPESKQEEEVDEARTIVLEKLRGWFRARPELGMATRDGIVDVVFRVRSQKALSDLTTDMLVEGLSTLETVALDWGSPTLKEEYQGWLRIQAAGNIGELFGEVESGAIRIGTPEAVPDEPVVTTEQDDAAIQPQTTEQRKLLAAAKKFARDAAAEAGIGVAVLFKEVDALAPEGFSRDYMTKETFMEHGVWMAEVVAEHKQRDFVHQAADRLFDSGLDIDAFIDNHAIVRGKPHGALRAVIIGTHPNWIENASRLQPVELTDLKDKLVTLWNDEWPELAGASVEA